MPNDHGRCATTETLAIKPAPVGQAADLPTVLSPTALAFPACTIETHALADLRPIGRVAVAELRADWHCRPSARLSGV